jgi:site-specific recombinase XerD
MTTDDRIRRVSVVSTGEVQIRPDHVAWVHALRHTMASRPAEDGANASEIRHILGNEDLDTSQVSLDATANEQRGRTSKPHLPCPRADNQGKVNCCRPILSL